MDMEISEDEQRQCPMCKEILMAGNFMIRLIDIDPKRNMSEWVKDPDKFNREKPLAQKVSISSHEDMFGLTVFVGCMNCFSRELDTNPLSKILFKTFWKTWSDLNDAKGNKVVLSPTSYLNVYL